jgi:tripartite-type tricarboxylate transporter receptor subunit TctC
MSGRRAHVGSVCLLIAVLGAGLLPVGAQDNFYRGKTVRIVVGFPSGGGYDSYSRAIGRHLAKHIPGKPAVIVENMPGAASLVAANHAYRTLKPDGLTIVNFQANQILGQLLGREGVEFDARKFVWVGAPMRENAVCALTKASGVTNMQQWMGARAPVKLGSTGVGISYDIGRVLQVALGLPIQIVRGYKGTAEIRLAAESGEIAGGCWLWESIKSTWRNGLESGDVTVLVQLTPKPLADLPRVPLALELAKSEEGRELIRVGIIVPTTIARLYALPPGTPADRAQTLRAAFLATLRDPEFQAEARQAKMDIDPIPADELERLVAELFKVPPPVAAKLKELLR